MPQPNDGAPAAEWAEYFSDVATAAKNTAQRRVVQGDDFGAECARARAQIYTEAAEELRGATDVHAAAQTIYHRGKQHKTSGSPPLIGFDAAAMDHLRASALQWCARQLDPSLPEIESSWT
jgi:hypothetical protein